MNIECEFCRDNWTSAINSLRTTFIIVFIISTILSIIIGVWDVLEGNMSLFSCIRHIVSVSVFFAGFFTVLCYIAIRNRLCELCFTPVKAHIKNDKNLIRLLIQVVVVFIFTYICEIYFFEHYPFYLYFFIPRIGEAILITGIVTRLYYKIKIKKHD